MRGLKGRTAIVTGGASGIGRATALRLGQEGCAVAIFDLDKVGAANTAEQLQAAGAKAQSYAVDISSREQVSEAVQASEAALGPTELLANVAGWDTPCNFLDSETSLWDKVIQINLYGALNMHHVVLPGMVERRFGRVVNVASDAGRVGSSGEAVYSACKGGLISFSKTLARELSRHNITLNTMCPGPTDTPLFDAFKQASPSGNKIAEAMARAIPLRRIGQPDDYPGTIAFLLSDDAGYITGQTISVSGGLTMHG